MSPSRSALLLLPLLLTLGNLQAEARDPRGISENKQCVKALGAMDFVRAQAHCDLGLEFDPQDSDLWTNEGLISLYLGNKKQAKEDFIKAIRFNQEQASAYLNLGRLYLDEDDYRKAEDSFLRALKVNPDYAEARYNLALCYMDMKKPAQAKKEFLTLLAADPNDAGLHHDLGVLYFTQGATGDAKKEILKAIRLEPQFTTWCEDLCAVEENPSRYQEDVQAFGICGILEHEPPRCPDRSIIIAQPPNVLPKAGLHEGRAPLGAKDDKAASRQQPNNDP